MQPVSGEKVCVSLREHLSVQQHAQTSLCKTTSRSSTQESSHHSHAGEGSTSGMRGHQPDPPLPGSASAPSQHSAYLSLLQTGHLRPCKARGCIQTSPAPALQMLLPALAMSPPDNVSLQLPLVHSPPLSPALPSPGTESQRLPGRAESGFGVGRETISIHNNGAGCPSSSGPS